VGRTRCGRFHHTELRRMQQRLRIENMKSQEQPENAAATRA
jgi:hypothetical protein